MQLSLATWLLASNSLSPYTTNPLNINPLREAIAAHVDIEAIRSKASPALYMTVTSVKTGLPRVIANDAMSIDALLAPSCLPTLFQAVEIERHRRTRRGSVRRARPAPASHRSASA
ncbi:MAG: hypothetical protein ABI537_06135 [Casimicrobiaceae bacterium]